MKTINSTVFKSEVRFQNDNKFSRLKISGYSNGYKISTKSDFEWRSIVNRIELKKTQVFCKHCMIRKKIAQI